MNTKVIQKIHKTKILKKGIFFTCKSIATVTNVPTDVVGTRPIVEADLRLQAGIVYFTMLTFEANLTQTLVHSSFGYLLIIVDNNRHDEQNGQVIMT